MQVKLDRDDFYYYFIHMDNEICTKVIDIPEADIAWIMQTFAEMNLVQKYLRDKDEK
jgi:hypothetical protein